jgi:hypothetical protein
MQFFSIQCVGLDEQGYLDRAIMNVFFNYVLRLLLYAITLLFLLK